MNKTQTVLGIPMQPICWISMKSMARTYDFSIFVLHDHFIDKVKPIHSTR